MVFDVVMEVIGNWLSDGYRVETPIGSFAPKLKLLGEHTDPKTIHGRDIVYAGIDFIPSKEFVKEGGNNREGYRKSLAQVGNSQIHPRLWKVRESRRWLYFPKKEATKE